MSQKSSKDKLNLKNICWGPTVHPGGSQVALVVKYLPAKAGNMRRRFDPWVWRIPWKREWQPTPVLLTGESHGQRSLVGYSSYSHKESDITEVTVCTHACTFYTQFVVGFYHERMLCLWQMLFLYVLRWSCGFYLSINVVYHIYRLIYIEPIHISYR